ncbi:DUF4116 domain-containing protein, partial [Vibrio mimicus]
MSISDRDNDEVVTDAVFFNCKALSFASDRFKSDISIVNIALNNSPAAASCIHEQLKKDISFAKEVISTCPSALKYFPDSLMDNDEIVNHAIAQDK